MEFAWSYAAHAQGDALIEFVRNTLNNNPADLEPDRVFVAEDWRKCADYGVLGLVASRTYGGTGLDPLTVVYLAEALGEVERNRGDSDGGLIYSGGSDIQRNIISRMPGL